MIIAKYMQKVKRLRNVAAYIPVILCATIEFAM